MTVKELKKEINQLKTYVKRVKERLEIVRENIRKISAIETRTTGNHRKCWHNGLKVSLLRNLMTLRYPNRGRRR